MRLLHYQPPTEHHTTTVFAVLWTLPIIVFHIFMLVAMRAAAEPFMILRATDAAVFFGAPPAIVAMAIVWCRVALAQRVHRIVIVLVLVWFVLVTAGAANQTVWYLREPWND